MTRPNVAKRWFEVWIEAPSGTRRRIDARRRSQKKAEQVRDELIATKTWVDVWIVEVNSLARCPATGAPFAKRTNAARNK